MGDTYELTTLPLLQKIVLGYNIAFIHYKIQSSFLPEQNFYASLCYFKRELIDDCPVASCCGKPPTLVTTLTVQGASGLEIPPTSKVKCRYKNEVTIKMFVKKFASKLNRNISERLPV